MRRWLMCWIAAAALAAARAGAAAAQPQLVWKADIGARVYSSPVACDLLPSPGLEVLVCASETRRVICLSAAGETLWSFGEGFTARITATPSVGDLTANGHLEIIAVDNAGNLVCLDREGQARWWVKLEGGVDWSAPVIADLDGHGRLAVAVGTAAGNLYRLDGDGSVAWVKPLGERISGLAAAADLTGDGKAELIVPVGRSVLCLNGAGETLWAFEHYAECNGVSVGDLEGDGAVEVLAAFDDQGLVCLDAAGRPKWAFHGGYAGGGASGFAAPVLCDLTGDGRLEIILSTGNGAVQCVSADGDELWYIALGSSNGDPPVVGDVDGDGRLEVIVGFEDGALVGLKVGAQGGAPREARWRYLTEFRTPQPGLADVDGDGRVEVLATSNDNFLYCLRAPGAGASGAVPWPSRRLDLGQTGAVGRR